MKNKSPVSATENQAHYLVLLILEFLPARLATLPHGLDSNVTQLLANMLTKPSVFYCLPIVPCNLVSIKLLLLLLLNKQELKVYEIRTLMGSYCFIVVS